MIAAPRNRACRPVPCGRIAGIGAWRSLVAHLLWEQRVGGSNPSAPTRILVFAPVAQPDRASAFESGACAGKRNRYGEPHCNGETLTGSADGNPVETVAGDEPASGSVETIRVAPETVKR